jgi:hypothetical protein
LRARHRHNHCSVTAEEQRDRSWRSYENPKYSLSNRPYS